jgi:hypothetical protein
MKQILLTWKTEKQGITPWTKMIYFAHIRAKAKRVGCGAHPPTLITYP